MENEIVLFETEDHEIKLNVVVENNTVWLNRKQLAELFGRDVKTIGKHINNALKEELEFPKAEIISEGMVSADFVLEFTKILLSKK